MELSQVLRALNAANNTEVMETLQQQWDVSTQTEPTNWDLLDSQCWRENREWSGCEERCDAALAEAVTLIKSRPELHLLAWHCHRLIFDVDDFDISKLSALIPILDNIKPDFNAVFFLWLTMGTVSRLRRRNKERGIPDDITKATLWDIAIAQRRYARYNDNKIGMPQRLLNWHRLVSKGDLHRVGRFEYIVRPFRGRLRAFRNRQTDDVMALSLPQIQYDEDGYFPLPSNDPDWISSAEITESTFIGHPISPRGFARSETVEISRDAWEEVLSPDDAVLEIHIPEGEPLSEEDCKESFEKAIPFFTKFYPEAKVRSFVCYSWLFNTQFETLFAPTSNIVGWQREVYEFPMPSTGNDGLYFVFGQDTIDPSTAPRDSKIRRAIVEHLVTGKTLRSGGMFFLFNDLEKYGTQCYRVMEKNWNLHNVFTEQHTG